MHRRSSLLTSVLPAFLAGSAEASERNPDQTFALQRARTSSFGPGRGCP